MRFELLRQEKKYTGAGMFGRGLYLKQRQSHYGTAVAIVSINIQRAGSRIPRVINTRWQRRREIIDTFNCAWTQTDRCCVCTIYPSSYVRGQRFAATTAQYEGDSCIKCRTIDNTRARTTVALRLGNVAEQDKAEK